MTSDEFDRATLRKVLWLWDVEADRIDLIQARSNVHWMVAARRGADLVLRRYRGDQSAASIDYEFDVLHHLAARGRPVAAPLGPAVLYAGSWFALFPRLSGAPKSDENASDLHTRGRLLAEVHHDLSLVPQWGQRHGWQRADEVVHDAADPRRWHRGVDGIPSAILNRVVDEFDGVSARLRRARADTFPVGVVHGDFIAQNLLFDGTSLAGILDFDSVHLDLRATDVAGARRSSTDGVVHGYLQRAPLTDIELATLDDLWRASVLRYAAQLLDSPSRIDAVDQLEWCVRQLDKTRPYGG